MQNCDVKGIDMLKKLFKHHMTGNDQKSRYHG